MNWEPVVVVVVVLPLPGRHSWCFRHDDDDDHHHHHHHHHHNPVPGVLVVLKSNIYPYTNTNKEKFGSFFSRALAYEVNGFPR